MSRHSPNPGGEVSWLGITPCVSGRLNVAGRMFSLWLTTGVNAFYIRHILASHFLLKGSQSPCHSENRAVLGPQMYIWFPHFQSIWLGLIFRGTQLPRTWATPTLILKLAASPPSPARSRRWERCGRGPVRRKAQSLFCFEGNSQHGALTPKKRKKIEIKKHQIYLFRRELSTWSSPPSPTKKC